MVTFQHTGRVGLGTDSPDYKLQVESTSDADLVSIKSTAIANNTEMRLGINGNDSVISGTGGSTGSLVFKTYGSERMRLTSGGAAIFNAIGTATYGTINLESDDPFIRLYHNGAGSTTDKKKWDIRGIGSAGSEQLDFRTVNDANTVFATKLTIKHNGDIEIPTDSASIKLRSSGSGNYTSINRDASNNLVVRNTANNSIFALENGGNLVIGGTLTQGSDISYKENIKPLESQLDIVSKLNPVSYNRIGKKENEIGFIAQEVEKLIPDLVSENPDGLKSLAYGNMTSILVKAIQELKAEVDLLKSNKCNCKN